MLSYIPFVSVVKVFLHVCNKLNVSTAWVGVLRWPIGSMSASHQCGPGLIPSWGSDPGAVSQKGLSSPTLMERSSDRRCEALPTYGARIRSPAGNRTQATLVRGRCATNWPSEQPPITLYVPETIKVSFLLSNSDQKHEVKYGELGGHHYVENSPPAQAVCPGRKVELQIKHVHNSFW